MYSRRHNKVSVPFFSGVTVFVTVQRELVSAELEGIAILRGIA